MSITATVLTVVAVGAAGTRYAMHREERLKLDLGGWRHNAKHFAKLLRNSQIGTWSWDVPSGEMSFNHRWNLMIGGPAEGDANLDFSSWVQLVHPEHLPMVTAQMQACVEGRLACMDCDMQVRRRNGDWIWVRVQGAVVDHADEGQAVRLAGTLIDTTDRTMEKLRAQHRADILDHLAHHAPLGDLLQDVARAITAVNPNHLANIRIKDPKGMGPILTAAPHLPAFFVNTLNSMHADQAMRDQDQLVPQLAVASDLASDPDWFDYRELAQRAGLGACWSRPIVSLQGTVLGSLTIFERQPKEPTTADLQALEEHCQFINLLAEKRMAAQTQQLAARAVRHAHEGICIFDTHGTIRDINEGFAAITGYSREDALGSDCRRLPPSPQGPEFFDTLWQQLRARGHWSGDIWYRRKSGDPYVQKTTISAMRDANGVPTHYVSMFTDNTSVSIQQQQLYEVAHNDALTKLPNRMLLAKRLDEAVHRSLAQSSSMAVAYLDLDGFKAVNDTYGHKKGDELLVVLSQRMQAVLREGDTLARMGGDEFVAVLVDLATRADADVVLQRLLATVAEPVTLGHTVVQVSVSIGATAFPADDCDPDGLLRHADQAMYTSKQSGKNRIHYFDVAQGEALAAQQEKLQRLEGAHRRGEFVLHYQPKVHTRTRALAGFEALLRWDHPTDGLLEPEAFLSDMENQPLSIAVGEWVITAALNQLAVWQRQGVTVPVSVNVSALQLQQPEFLDRLRQLLAQHPDVPPQRLELEILETSALQDLGSVSRIMRACGDMGIRFAIDDFGTGYSTFTYLRQLPASQLKIDRSFVNNMLCDPSDLAIVRAVIGFGHAFQLDVVAEGVESPEHWEALQALGCDQVQGFGIGRPLPAGDVVEWVRTWETSESRQNVRAHMKLVALQA